MARPTQQTFSASIGSSLKSGPYLSHIYSGEEETAEIKQQPKESDTNCTDCASSEPQGNKKDSRLDTAYSQELPGAYLKHQKAP